jgi:hypothetical protein
VTPPPPRFHADRPEGRDVMGFGPDIEALARLVASDALDPPLSIGLFGEWGSGKSHFLRQLRDRVTILARAAAEERQVAGVRPPPYVAHVVHVEFNAWNYVEVDLWASLVAHIFDRLHAHVTRADAAEQRRWESLLHRLDDAEQRQREAKRALVLAQARLDERRREQAERERTLLAQLAILRKHSTFGPLIRDVERALGLEVAHDLWDAIVLRRERAQAIVEAMPSSLRAARSLLRRPAAAWLIAAILLVGVGAFVAAHVEWFPNLAALAAAAVLLVRWMQTAIDKTDAVMRTIARFQEAILELDRLEDEADRAAVERLREYASAVEQAKAEHEAEVCRVEELRREIAQLYPGERLADFLAERANSGDYRRHLGLPALVRRDFDRLGRLVRPDTRRMPFAELADLAEGRVPAALDALLRIDAPVRNPVIVGRGDTWELTDHDGARRVEITRAGTEAIVETSWPDHPTIERIVLYIDDLDRCPPARVVDVLAAVNLLLAFPLFVVVVAVDERWLVGSLEHLRAGNLELGAFGGATGARDFLEKIFQIPYRVPTLTTAAAIELVDELVAPQASPPSAIALDVDATALDDGERASLRELAVLVQRSPRSVKRFVNVYRVVRSTLGASEQALLRGDDGVAFGPIAILIALMVGDPRTGASLGEVCSRATGTVREAFASWLRTPDGTPRTPAITALLEGALGRPGWAATHCTDARALVERVRRFSFGVIE